MCASLPTTACHSLRCGTCRRPYPPAQPTLKSTTLQVVEPWSGHGRNFEGNLHGLMIKEVLKNYAGHVPTFNGCLTWINNSLEDANRSSFCVFFDPSTTICTKEIQWMAPSNNGGMPISGYKVQRANHDNYFFGTVQCLQADNSYLTTLPENQHSCTLVDGFMWFHRFFSTIVSTLISTIEML